MPAKMNKSSHDIEIGMPFVHLVRSPSREVLSSFKNNLERHSIPLSSVFSAQEISCFGIPFSGSIETEMPVFGTKLNKN